MAREPGPTKLTDSAAFDHPGMQANALYNDCGGKSVSFPQRTIYDSLREHNVSFGFFMNSTCGIDGKPCHGEDPITTDSPSAISTPDVALEGVARYAPHGQSGHLGEATAGHQRLVRLHMKAWGCPPHYQGTWRLRSPEKAMAQPQPAKVVMFAAFDQPGTRSASSRRSTSTTGRRRGRCPPSRGSTRPSRRATTRARTSPRASGCSRTSTRRCARRPSGAAWSKGPSWRCQIWTMRAREAASEGLRLLYVLGRRGPTPRTSAGGDGSSTTRHQSRRFRCV